MVHHELRYLDSLDPNPNNRMCLDNLARYIMDDCAEKNLSRAPSRQRVINTTEWTQDFRVDTPQQSNGSDCGVHMCKLADFISRAAHRGWWGDHVLVTTENMPYFRRRMILEVQLPTHPHHTTLKKLFFLVLCILVISVLILGHDGGCRR